MRNWESSQRRVVITGIGVVAPNGSDLTTFWETVRDGTSAAGPVTRFKTDELPNKIAAEIRDFDAAQYVDVKKKHRFERSILYGLAAAKMAVADGGIDIPNMDSDRLGVAEATSVSGMESSFEGQTAFESKGYRSMSPFTLINAYCGGGSGEIALELGVKGLALSYSSGSASGNDIIGYAASVIQEDETDVMIAGGTEAPILAPLWGAFCLTKVMTKNNADPPHSMRPFDRDRDGFLLGEGAAFFVLEELSHALGRGARIYAEVLGHGRSCEAHHSVAPHPEGVGVYRAMEKALRRARLNVGEIHYVNAHGTATELNDVAETRAIKRIFREHARRLAVSSTKPVTGHLLAAAGAIETAICALAIHHQVIPPTMNFNVPAPDCDLDYVAGEARPYPIGAVMNLNCGFGGKNSCLILKRMDGVNG